MSTLAELHKRWSRKAGYRAAYERLEPEFDAARALIEARTSAAYPGQVSRMRRRVVPVCTPRDHWSE